VLNFPGAPNHNGSISAIDSIEKTYPGYICSLFCYAHKIRGALAIFTYLVATMNAKSVTILNKPTTFISRLQLNSWFSKQGGKEPTPMSKPLETPEHTVMRLEWVNK